MAQDGKKGNASVKGDAPRNQLIKYTAIPCKKKGKTNLLLQLSAAAFCLLLTLLFVSVMSGGFFLDIASESARVKVYEREYFALVYGSYSEYGEAERAAASLKARGGAGYIRKESAYKVLAALYLVKADAEQVSRRLSKGGTDFSVHVIAVPAYSFPYDPETAAQDKVERAVNLLPDTVEKLYALFVDLEGNAVSEPETQNRLTAIKSDISTVSEALGRSGDTSREMVRLKAELVALSLAVSVITDTDTYESTGTLVKYAMIKIAYSLQSFAKEI